MRADRARDQPETPYQQNQHDESVEKGGWLEVDMKISDHARENKERPANRQ